VIAIARQDGGGAAVARRRRAWGARVYARHRVLSMGGIRLPQSLPW